jgi:hypothetical protein
VRAEPDGRRITPPSGLPAPYRSPWKRLAADLEAVGADLVLRARELRRRNGEGSLWRPGFWPSSWAAWFWPLILLAALVLAAGGVGLVGRLRPLAPELRFPVQDQGRPTATAVAPPAAPSLLEEDPLSLPVPAEEPQPEAAPAAEPEPAPAPGLESLPAPLPLPGPEEVLKQAFAALAPPDLIQSARPDPATATLQLEVADAFARLEPSRRRELAEDWRVLAFERGYERLEVVDDRGRLWARPAAVGGGLVVLAFPLPPAPL